jgi:Transposase DDE domain
MRHVLLPGAITAGTQRAAWCQTIEAFDEGGGGQARQVALFPEDRAAPALDCDVVHVRLSGLQLRRPRQWGACWLACELWEQLRLDEFWSARLAPSREGTRWLNVLKTLVAYRLIDPGSEWRLHRQGFEQSAMSDLLGEDFGLVSKDKLYRCLDKLLAHKAELFSFLQQRWRALFHAEFDVLLYNLTSTYFECDPPENSKRRFGYSRDKRSDCVQLVIALVVTPEGFPLAYEVMPGNTADKTTLRDFIRQIETQYGKLRRTWVMDRGIPTEAVLAEMRQSATPMCYLVGTPRGRLSQMEQQFLDKPWTEVRETLRVKLVEQDGELYVLARSDARRDKEQAMRRRRLKKLVKRLHELRRQKLTRDRLLIKLGAAKKEAGPAIYRIIDIQLPEKDQPVTPESFSFRLNWQRLREARRREGSYLLRSNMTGTDARQLWTFYL